MKANGFNLIELAVAMAIIITVSGSCYYGYQRYQHTLERKQAALTLQDIALSLEQHKRRDSGYRNLSLEGLGFATTKNQYHYRLSTTKHTYLIQADPAFTDLCGSLSLNEQGVRTSKDISACW